MVDVFVVAPVRVIRQAVAEALDNVANADVVGMDAQLVEALPQLRERRPDVVILASPRAQDLEYCRAATTEAGVALLAIGMPEDDAVAWMEAGVAGYVSTAASVAEVVDAVVSVARGEIVAPPEVSAHLLHRVRALSATAPDVVDEARLTPRETEVLRLVDEGLSNKQIAVRLSIQEQTVKNHIHNVLLKVGAHSRGEAAARMRHRAHRK